MTPEGERMTTVQENANIEHRFILRGRNKNASLRISNGMFILERGSYINLPSPTFERNNTSYYRRFLEIVQNEIDTNRCLTRDVEFSSPSAAAAIANGRATNGKTDWIDEEGVTIGTYLSGLADYENFDFDEYINFYHQNIGDINTDPLLTVLQQGIAEFRNEYPLDRLRNLSIVEYCLGTEQSQNSLSYKLEFGIYRHLGFSIGGGSSKKFGIYYSADNQYIGRDGVIADIGTYWTQFREQLCSCIQDFDTAIEPFYTHTRYPLLRGISLVLTKLLFLYHPEKFINIAKRVRLVKLLKLFKFSYDETLPSEQLSFVLNRKLREKLYQEEVIPLGYLGHSLWNYIEQFHPDQEENDADVNYWVYTPGKANGSQWDKFYSSGIMAIWDDIGDLQEFASKKEIKDEISIRESSSEDSSLKNRVLSKWQFVHDMHIGDVIFAKRGKTTLLGRGIVKSDYLWDPTKGDYASYRVVEWTDKGIWDLTKVADDPFVLKQLTNITRYEGYAEKLESLIHPRKNIKSNEYNKESFLKEVFISDEKFENIMSLLERKKNIILQGSPGVGKTFMAKRLMYALIKESEDTNIETVQFHQSYSYEDFIQGYRPNDDGQFELKDGLFYRLVDNARKDYEINKENAKKYCIIIDEINRGNLSKIFGEIMMLIESDKRHPKWKLSLTYSGVDDEKFYIPENLYIIGTMNTADRSLAMVDYALRRRFAFIDLEPAFGTTQFTKYMTEVSSLPKNFVDRLNTSYIALNNYISEKIGRGFVIGHSYFVDQFKDYEDLNQSYQEILQFEIKPLLEEYFFQDKDKVTDALELVDFEI